MRTRWPSSSIPADRATAQGRDAHASQRVSACLVGDRRGTNLSATMADNVMQIGVAAHHSVVSRQRVGHGAHHHGGRRHARHDSPLQPGGSVSPDRARASQEPAPWCPPWSTRWCILPRGQVRLEQPATRSSIGGAASSPTLVKEAEEKLGCTCISGYGLTETCPTLANSPMKSGMSWEGEQRYVGQAMTGFAIPGVELRVVDARRKGGAARRRGHGRNRSARRRRHGGLLAPAGSHRRQR